MRLPTPQATAQGRIEWRPLDPAGDLDLVHGWMHQPHVAPYWELAVPRAELAGYLHRVVAVAGQRVLIGSVDGEPVSYWEVYWAETDRLADLCPVQPWDQGVHLLIGPPDRIGRGLGGPLLTAVCDWLFDREPRTGRLLAEPDVRNARSVALFSRCGFTPAGEFDFPEKRAVLMVREREQGQPA